MRRQGAVAPGLSWAHRREKEFGSRDDMIGSTRETPTTLRCGSARPATLMPVPAKRSPAKRLFSANVRQFCNAFPTYRLTETLVCDRFQVNENAAKLRGDFAIANNVSFCETRE